MSVDTEPVYWPEKEGETEKPPAPSEKPRIAQLRHRIGEYDVTRLIFDATDETQKEED